MKKIVNLSLIFINRAANEIIRRVNYVSDLKLSVVLIGLFFCISCSNQQVYEGIQWSNKTQCNNLPVEHQDECFNDTNSMSYEEYQAEREKVLSKSTSE